MIGAADGLVRGARSASFAVASGLLAVGAHVAGGGAPPGVLGTAATLALSSVAARVAGRRPRGTAGNLAVLTAVQLLLHEVLAATGGAAGGPSGTAGHCPEGMPEALAGGAGHHAAAGGWMPVTHAVALALTALLLARGERLAEATARALTAVPRLLAGLARPDAPGRPRPTALVAARPGPARAVPSLRACTPVVRRGPPVPAC